MEDTQDKKNNMGQLISSIIENEENLGTFVFFVNKLENIRRPISEIKAVLNDYLCICKEITVKGKKRVKHIDDRHVLHCEENIGFLDASKIEIIANAVLAKNGVKLPVTIHDFKRKYKKTILRNDDWGKKYKDLMITYQEGDEIFEVITPRWTWKQLCGRSVVALERDGIGIVVISKSMN